MPRASAVPVRRRAGGLATVLVLAAALAPSGVAVAAPSPPTDDFAPDPVQEETVAGPYGIALGDRNRDTRPDAFIAQWDAGVVLVRPGTAAGPGTRPFDSSAEIVVPTTGHPREVDAADWDGDGADDAVILLEGAGLTVWTGTPLTGDLAIPNALALATGDIDGDGDPDAAVVRNREDSGSVQLVVNGSPLPSGPLLGRGAEVPMCDAPTDVQLVDVTADGKPDLIVACPSLGMVRVRAGMGDGTFAATAISSPAGASPYRLATGDVDGDGRVDLAVSSVNAVRIMRGFGTGSFGTPTSYAAAGVPRRPQLADVDGDGRPDLATTTADTLDQDGIGFRLNRGDGTFGTERRIAWSGAWDARIADVTGDERPDVVASTYGLDGFGVWEGRPAPNPVVELSGLGIGVYEGAAGVALDPDARILGASAATATTMTISIASGRAAGDALSATPAAPFSTAWNEAAGTLTISAPLPQPSAAWRAALRTVRFAHVAGATRGATAGRRIVRARIGVLPFAARSIDVWLRPPEAGELRLTGVPVTGETLALDAGPWGGTPPVALRTTLERCPASSACVALATDLPYILRSADLGATLRVRAVGTGPDGTSATAFSPRTATIRRLAAPELLSGPGDVTADGTVEVAFRGEEGATFACTVDGGAQTPCVSPLRVSGLADGGHTIRVVQVLPSGARSAAASRTFTVRRPVEPPPVTITTPAPPPVTVTTPAPPPPADTPRAPARPALVAPSRATAAQLRRGLVVRVQNVAKGARATATLQSGRRRVVATSTRATRAGTLQLRLRAASAAVARLGRRGTLGLAVTVAAPGVRQVTLAARIAFRR